MLQPTNRLTLIDAMRPPVAFRLESAMAVTFTLDLRALLAAPAALALTGPDGVASDGGTHEPIELLHALRSHASKITVFSQVGEIALPPSRRVFAFLERAVVPVAAPLGGVVHPKVWVFRYEAAGDPSGGQSREQRLRVLISSRNLTFDASWDTVIRLDEATDAAGARLGPVGELFEGLLDAAVGTVSTEHQQRVQSLSAALHTARFALPSGVDDLRIHVLGLTRTPSPLPASVGRSLIISPFVSNDFFLRVRPEPVDELVSRAESLDLLGSGALANVATAYAFDDGSAPALETAEERLSLADPGRPLVGLHAKVFVFEDEGRARLFVGSANATGAAFNSNVEILVELAGPTSVLGIDRLCNGTEDERGLRDLFVSYSGPDPNSTNGETPLDSTRRAIARIAIEGCIEESGSGWAVTPRPSPAPTGGTGCIEESGSGWAVTYRSRVIVGAKPDESGTDEGGGRYWRDVLRHSIEGNLQAVLDEHAHVLRDWLGHLNLGDDGRRIAAADDIALTVAEALELRTSSFRVDIPGRERRGRCIDFDPHLMRARFAVAFGNQILDDGGEARVESVSKAFNSPFWPFVLTSTSVGQEGLDFHLWCHAVVHWNLPANPVDLEQREGRVHRYRGHAVRRNIAATLGPDLLAHGLADSADPWNELFAIAVASRPASADEMVVGAAWVGLVDELAVGLPSGSAGGVQLLSRRRR